MKSLKRAYSLAIAFVIFLSACSPTQQAYQQNIKLYFSSNKDVVLSNKAITDSPADLIYVKNGERPTVTMALAFIENNRYKWLSRDQAMIITENGRISRMVGFQENLIYVSNTDVDPIKLRASIGTNGNHWKRRIDTDVGDIGAYIESNMMKTEGVLVNIQGIELSTVKIEENVSYNSIVFGKESWKNTFWFHDSTQQLVKSSQTLAPNIDKIDITYISRVLRLTAIQNEDTF